jgi:hypothetical protein
MRPGGLRSRPGSRDRDSCVSAHGRVRTDQRQGRRHRRFDRGSRRGIGDLQRDRHPVDPRQWVRQSRSGRRRPGGSSHRQGFSRLHLVRLRTRPRASSATGARKPFSSAIWWARCFVTPRSSAISTRRTLEERLPVIHRLGRSPIGTEPGERGSGADRRGRGHAACRPGPSRRFPRTPPGPAPAGHHSRPSLAAWHRNCIGCHRSRAGIE